MLAVIDESPDAQRTSVDNFVREHADERRDLPATLYALLAACVRTGHSDLVSSLLPHLIDAHALDADASQRLLDTVTVELNKANDAAGALTMLAQRRATPSRAALHAALAVCARMQVSDAPPALVTALAMFGVDSGARRQLVQQLLEMFASASYLATAETYNGVLRCCIAVSAFAFESFVH